MLRRKKHRVITLVAAPVVGILLLSACSAPQADRSAAAVEDAWVVSLGDSYISGEAGRWAGNQTPSSESNDALSFDAYADALNGEEIAGCHRSKSAVIHIGDAQSKNLACSGAVTSTRFDGDRSNFKPGIDFYDQDGLQGQALMLQEFATTHPVKLVALSIGGNDFKFSSIVAACVGSFVDPAKYGANCKDNPNLQAALSPQAADKVRRDTTQAILNIATAMENAGYADSDWTLGLQLYPDVLPDPSAMRFSESGPERLVTGGCAIRDQDAVWASDTVLNIVNTTFQQAAAQAVEARPSLQVVTLDTTNAFDNRTLCHQNVHRVQDANGAQTWRQSDAADLSEWVMEIITDPNNASPQESLHPNFWGQMALRSCWRQVWNNGDVRGGTCTRSGTGLNEFGEPVMRVS